MILSLAACVGKEEVAAPTAWIPFEIPEQAEEIPTPQAEPTPKPFQFSLPMPGAEPITNWRPPLYPVPWAIGPFDHFYFTRPIAADQTNWPIADYRYGGTFFGRNIVHTGVDIPAPKGTPIMAAAAGTIVWADWGLFLEIPGDWTDPYGMAVAIRHDFGYEDQQLYTIYAHMSQINVIKSQHVEAGDIIGYVGSTGATTGPHVHFEVRFPNNAFFYTYNPELWIAPPQGWGILAGRIMNRKGELSERMEILVAPQRASRTYTVRTYGKDGATNADPYYRENFALGDLPAGIYKVSFRFDDKRVETWLEIFPGQVTYFTYKENVGFTVGAPPAPTPNFVPYELPVTPTP